MVYILYNGAQRGLLFAKFLFLYTNAAKSSLSTVPFFSFPISIQWGKMSPKRYGTTDTGGVTGRKTREIPFSRPPVSHTWLPLTEQAGSHFNKDMEMLLQCSFNEDRAKNTGRWIWEKNAWQMAWSPQRMLTKCRPTGKVLSTVPAIQLSNKIKWHPTNSGSWPLTHLSSEFDSQSYSSLHLSILFHFLHKQFHAICPSPNLALFASTKFPYSCVLTWMMESQWISPSWYPRILLNSSLLIKFPSPHPSSYQNTDVLPPWISWPFPLTLMTMKLNHSWCHCILSHSLCPSLFIHTIEISLLASLSPASHFLAHVRLWIQTREFLDLLSPSVT